MNQWQHESDQIVSFKNIFPALKTFLANGLPSCELVPPCSPLESGVQDLWGIVCLSVAIFVWPKNVDIFPTHPQNTCARGHTGGNVLSSQRRREPTRGRGWPGPAGDALLGLLVDEVGVGVEDDVQPVPRQPLAPGPPPRRSRGGEE